MNTPQRKRVFLGTTLSDFEHGAMQVFLEKHEWECDWYWSFGNVGNRQCWFHFDAFLKNNKRASELFANSQISDKDWWVIRDLFIQAYALKKAAEVYRYGGHQTSEPGVTDMIRNAKFAALLNTDLERVLNMLWDRVCLATAPAATIQKD